MKILVGMSGGVDSSVAALLMQQAGAEVEGVYFHQVSDPDFECDGSTCCGETAIARARTTASMLGIYLHVVDLRKLFDAEIISPTQAAMDTGNNPAPCSSCNARVRGPSLRKYAAVVGAQAYATGHYARNVGGRINIAADPSKDQSYMMALVAAADLQNWLMPLGSLTKPEVRRIATDAGLPAASTPDSQDLCFAHVLRSRQRTIVDESGKAAGTTNRHPVLGAKRGFGGKPVVGISDDLVRIGEQPLLASSVVVSSWNWHGDPRTDVAAVTRYHGQSHPARVVNNTVEFSVPLAPSIGQVIALYDGQMLLGGGITAGFTRAQN